ncbi:TraY domain-containing protein [Methylobacterium nonmethylotrophicum]|uniref:Relaxosome protein TraY n=2 Tax=Methylobacterium nonmethylotrophicum TaxID=1141884 RepID=A0A4Z0NDU8_9HYPH|nr:TraY domain-containing protein [Methylobacterium nonmethylotrophicum]
MLRSKLEAAAEMNGRSLTQEVEFRLERSLEQDELLVALVGQASHAQNLVRAVSTVIRRVEGVTGRRFTDHWETLFYCRRAVSKVCNFVFGSDYNDQEFFAMSAADEDERRRYAEEADRYAYDALRDLGLGLPPAPGGREADMSRRLPLDPFGEEISATLDNLPQS